MIKRLFLLCALLLLLFPQEAARAQEARNVPLTRAEAAAVLLKLRTPSLPVIANVGQFPDVPAGRQYERSLLAAERYGILTANAEKRLRPDDPVTRAVFLKMITLTFGLTTHQQYDYHDVSAASWIGSYAGIAARYNLFGAEKADSLLLPNLPLTQLEAKNILQMLLDAHVIKGSSPETAGQGPYKLAINETMSSQTEEYTRIQSNGLRLVIPDTSEQEKIIALKERVLALVNEERLSKGIPPLHMDAYLNASAQEYAEEMALQGFFGHVSPSGQKLRDRMKNSGYYNPNYLESCLCIRTFLVGENLARGQKTPEEAVADWIKSPTHHALILNPSFAETGIGIQAGIWVEHFGGVKFTDEE